MRDADRNSPVGGAAFTLIEMLVVMAIIGVLAGMILPALSTARESGRQTVCINNLHQHGLAFQFYTKTFDTFPPYELLKSPEHKEPWCKTFIDKGYITGEIMICPSSKNPLKANFMRKGQLSLEDSWFADYGLNWLWMCSSNGTKEALGPFEDGPVGADHDVKLDQSPELQHLVLERGLPVQGLLLRLPGVPARRLL